MKKSKHSSEWNLFACPFGLMALRRIGDAFWNSADFMHVSTKLRRKSVLRCNLLLYLGNISSFGVKQRGIYFALQTGGSHWRPSTVVKFFLIQEEVRYFLSIIHKHLRLSCASVSCQPHINFRVGTQLRVFIIRRLESLHHPPQSITKTITIPRIPKHVLRIHIG